MLSQTGRLGNCRVLPNSQRRQHHKKQTKQRMWFWTTSINALHQLSLSNMQKSPFCCNHSSPWLQKDEPTLSVKVSVFLMRQLLDLRCNCFTSRWCNETEELTTGRWCLMNYIRVWFMARETRWVEVSWDHIVLFRKRVKPSQNQGFRCQPWPKWWLWIRSWFGTILNFNWWRSLEVGNSYQIQVQLLK